MIENSRRMIAGQLMPAHVAFQEMIRANKSKMIRSQAKRKIVPCRMTAECEADTGNKSCARRQRSPAAEITVMPPADP